MIALVAAVAKNGVIGKKNALPWYLPEDLKRFKALTTGKIVLMGRKTFESILARNGKPLPNRKNVVVTREANYSIPEGVELYHTIDEALKAHVSDEIMVAGGGQIYKQTIDRADRLYITQVNQKIAGDVYFPPLDLKIWKEVEREDHERFSFVTYAR